MRPRKPIRVRRRTISVNPLPHPLPLRTDGGGLGLRRLVVPTWVGDVVVRAGREAGGPATILLHGAAGSWTTWTPLIAASDLSGSPLTDVIADQTNSALEGLVEGVAINWVWMPPWGPDKITEDGREQLRALGFTV